MTLASNKNVLYEVVIIRLFLIVTLVFYHAFAIFSGVWTPIDGYPSIPLYALLDKLSYACLLEAFVFISGYLLGNQVQRKGESSVFELQTYLIKKVNRLIIPSLLFSVLYWALFYNDPITSFSSIYKILCGVGHMWFLPMLFWCFVFIVLVEKIDISSKWKFIIILFFMIASILPLPFRIGTALYYFAFFYAGFYIQKNSITIKQVTRKKIVQLIAIFSIAFTIKTLQSNIFPNFGGGINAVLTLMLRFLCAFFGVSLLLVTAMKLLRRITIYSKTLLELSDCCFGVYLFQQFILIIFNDTTLPNIVHPFLYPWVIFIASLFISAFLTIGLRKNKIGRSFL